MQTVLLPGTLCDQALWAGVALPPGATPLAEVRGPDLSAAARRVLDSLDGPFHLLGFSLGAIVAFEVLRVAPERVAQLTLLSANPHAPTAAQLAAWDEQERLVREGRFLEVARQLSQGAGQHHETVQEMAQRVGPEVFLEQLQLLRSRPDSRPALSAYRGPCQLLVGEHDQVTPMKFTQEMAELLPQARVQVVKGAGHYLPLDAPEAVTSAFTNLTEVQHG